MIELKSSRIFKFLRGWMIIDCRREDRRLTEGTPVGPGVSFELDLSRRKYVRPSSPIVSFLGKYFVFIFLAKGVKYPGFSSRVLWRRCWSGMGCKLIAMGLGFSLAFVLASTVAVMVMPVMARVMTASIVVTTVMTTVVSLRRFRWTMASWPCVLMLRWCALIMPVHFPTGTGRG